MQSAYNQTAIGVQSEAIRGQDRLLSEGLAGMQVLTTMPSPKVWQAITMQSPCNQHALSGNQTHLCLLSEGLQQIIGAHASRRGDDRARPDHRGATAAAAAAIVPQLPLALIFETLRRCVHGACMHVVVGRPSVAISMRRCVHGACMHVVVGRPSVAISMRRCVHGACMHVVVGRHSVAISMHSVAIQPRACMHVVVGILFAAVRWPSVAISGTHLHARGSWDPLCSPLTMVWRG